MGSHTGPWTRRRKRAVGPRRLGHRPRFEGSIPSSPANLFRESGGTGRRTGLLSWSCKMGGRTSKLGAPPAAWGFESPLSHQYIPQ